FNQFVQVNVLYHASGAEIVWLLHQFARRKVAEELRSFTEISAENHNLPGRAWYPFLDQDIGIHLRNPLVFGFQLFPTVTAEGLAAAYRLPLPFTAPQIRTYGFDHTRKADLVRDTLQLLCVVRHHRPGYGNSSDIGSLHQRAFIQHPS